MKRPPHEIKNPPPGRAICAGHSPTAQGKGSGGAYHHEFDEISDDEMRGYVLLWRAVFAQQIMDAKSRRTKQEYGYIRNSALFWLLHNNQDFRMVCDLAGLDPDTARQRIRAAQARGFIWRSNDGKQPTKFQRQAREESSMALLRDSATARPSGHMRRIREITQMELTF